MKSPRLLLCLVVLALLPGCAGYTKFRSTNYRGELIAEWTGKGFYYPVSGGYRINAVERISGPPHSLVSRYPDGHSVTVTGPNILRWHISKPLWMYELERPYTPTANNSRREIHPLERE